MNLLVLFAEVCVLTVCADGINLPQHECSFSFFWSPPNILLLSRWCHKCFLFKQAGVLLRFSETIPLNGIFVASWMLWKVPSRRNCFPQAGYFLSSIYFLVSRFSAVLLCQSGKLSGNCHVLKYLDFVEAYVDQHFPLKAPYYVKNNFANVF